jgi:Myb/SANT-like DNA-binding domain
MGKSKKSKKEKKKRRQRSRSVSPTPPAPKKARERSPSPSSASTDSGDEQRSNRNYTFRETETLVSEYRKYFDVMDTSIKSMSAVRRRDQIWKDIAGEVSKVHGTKRLSSSVQDKMKKLRSRLKLEGIYKNLLYFVSIISFNFVLI